MASRLKYGNHNRFDLPLPSKLNIKIAIKSLCRSYKNETISKDSFNQIMRALITASIENDIADKLLAKSHCFDEKMNKRDRLSV